MATISENLQIIKNSTLDIKQAIINKGGIIKGDITTWANSVSNIPSGGEKPSVKISDVTFYDYDGTVLYAYTKDEFLALNELPALPTQPGLICQEWNWSFEDAVEYVSEYGKLNIGATYITDDAKTRLYIQVLNGIMDVSLYFSQTVSNGVTISWGDGSTTQTISGTGNKNTTHTYASVGDYCITLTVAEGCTLGLGHASQSYCIMGQTSNNRRAFLNSLKKIELGNNVYINSYAFYLCTSLKTVVLPKNILQISNHAFDRCFSLYSLIVPNSNLQISNYAFTYCSSMNNIILPPTISINNNIFEFCQSINSVIIPTTINKLTYTFSKCYALSGIIIPKQVTTLSSAFYDCWSLRYCDFSKHTSVPTLSNTNAFSSIPSDCKIIVPDNLYDTWKTATNWSTYASKIIKKSDWEAL